MSTETEPFHGIWRFNPKLSNTCTPAPQSWIQEISAGPDEVTVREQIVRTNGSEIVLRVRARFDGVDYPVEGSPTVDTIAYTRAHRHAIFGIGRKNGAVSLTETVLADPEQRIITLAYNYLLGERIVAQGVAVFQSAQVVPSDL
jgi:hypothetical protein